MREKFVVSAGSNKADDNTTLIGSISTFELDEDKPEWYLKVAAQKTASFLYD